MRLFHQVHQVRRLAQIGSLGSATLLGLALCSAFPTAAAGASRAEAIAEHRAVCIRGVCFDAEIAVTAAERSQGLMFRETLAKTSGMLFVFPEEAVHRFWMKNTRIELDIVFIGADLKVVSIARRAQPCRKDPCDLYGPEGKVAYALEIAGGLAEANGFRTGDLVEFRESTSSP